MNHKELIKAVEKAEENFILFMLINIRDMIKKKNYYYNEDGRAFNNDFKKKRL